MKFFCIIILLVSWSSDTIERSYPNSPSYMAAVVEYSPVMESNNGEDIVEINTQNYLKMIDKATNYEIDVMVFPENSLTVGSSKNETIKRSQTASYIPNPVDNIIPCDDKDHRYKNSLKTMSCAARDHQIYMVVNHREKVDCTPNTKGCAADGFLIYNTNVVFDRQGQVIVRYRKYNLYKELGVNVTVPIPTTFKSDFGVTFGTFICFDLVFQTPALNLTRDLGITDFLYSTHWFDIPPLPYAIQTEAGWAYANDVNLLAAGQSTPRTTSEGAGIHLGKQGYLHVVSKKMVTNVLIVAEIPKIIEGKRTLLTGQKKLHVHEFTNNEITSSADFKLWKIPLFQFFKLWKIPLFQFFKLWKIPLFLFLLTTETIDLKEKSINTTIYRGRLHCHFKLSIDFDQSSLKKNSLYYRYRFAVLNGVLPLAGVGKIGAKVCGIVACSNDELESCGHIFKSDENIVRTTFTSLEISTSNITNKDTLVMPMSVTQDLIPLNVTDFSYSTVDFGEASKHHMSLKNPINNILEFGILVRDFASDDRSGISHQ